MLKLAFISAFLFLHYTPLILAQLSGDCEGQAIGELPNLAHGVSGQFYIENSRSFCIQDFNYDGQGPDTFLYFYYPGDPIQESGGGVYISLTPERSQFEVNRAYTNEILRFTLPENRFRTCDFEAFGIWCRYANQLFTSITWMNDEIFSESTLLENPILCVSSPGRGFVGTLPTNANDVGGLLYVKDNKTLVIRDFTLNGDSINGRGTFVYAFPIGVAFNPEGTGGTKILLEANNGGAADGSFDGTVYRAGMDDFTIPIPNNTELFTCDIETLAIICTECTGTRVLTTLAFSRDLFTNSEAERAYRTNLILCDRPSTRPGVLVGDLPSTNRRFISGTLYVQNNRTLFIQLFSYDGSRPNTVYLYYYPPGQEVTANGEGGFKVALSASQDGLLTGRQNFFFNQDLTIDLNLAETDAGGVLACEIGTFTIYDPEADEHITKIEIPDDIFSMTAMEGKIQCSSGATPLVSAKHVLVAMTLAILAMFI